MGYVLPFPHSTNSASCAPMSGPRKKSECAKKQSDVFSPCRVGVIYRILSSSCSFFMGQTGRCTNDRMREDHRSLDGGPSRHFALHSKGSGCEYVNGRPDPSWEDTKAVLLGWCSKSLKFLIWDRRESVNLH